MKRTNIVLLGFFASVILAGCFFWFQQKQEVKSPVIEPSQRNQVSTKSFQPVSGEDDKVWFPVPELGIEIKVNKDIAPELVYKASKADWEPEYAKYDIMSAWFTTEKLNDIAKKNGSGVYDNKGWYSCFIGIFTRYNMSKQEYIALQTKLYGKEYLMPVEVDGYFIEEGSAQASCGSGKEDMDYEQSIAGWWGRSSSEYSETFGVKENLQESVKKIR